MFRASLLTVVVLDVLSACATTQPTDELAGESADDGEAGKGDSTSAFTFFTVTPDKRACSFDSRCGGFYVSRANRTTTTCGRGSTMERCYVDTLDLTGTAMPQSVADSYKERMRNGESFLLRGDISPGADDRHTSLFVTEVWPSNQAAGQASQAYADGVFVLIKDSNIRCITAPCPSRTELRLNSNRFTNIDEVDLSPAGADDDANGRADAGTIDGTTIVLGDRYYFSHGAKGRAANQFFTKAPVPLH